MRYRDHEVKFRLNDNELEHLNKMVGQSPYNRETFLRLMVAGYSMREVPKEYLQFRMELIRMASDLRLYRWNKSLSEQQVKELDKLSGRIWEFIRRLNKVYWPYFKEEK